jgi:hypothetical protein
MGTTDVGYQLQLISISVLVRDEVSAPSLIADRAIGLRTAVGGYVCLLAVGLQDNLTKRHRNVMLVAKSGKVPFHLEAGHMTSFKAAEKSFSGSAWSEANSVCAREASEAAQA